MMDKKGFFSVYACLFLVTILTAAGLFIGAAKKSAATTAAQACSSLWSQSILAEYDLNLQRRYHLFGYYGHRALVQEKLDFYAKESYGERRSPSLQITSCSIYEHCLRNTDVFGKQVVSCGKIALTDAFEEPAKSIQSVTHHQKPSRQVLFDHLPSEGCKSGLTLSKLTKNHSLKSLAKKGSDTYFQLAYTFAHFKDQSDARDLGETYLQSEVEYMIGGKTTDSGNERVVKQRIIALREPINLAFLESDPTKSSAVYAAAALLTPEAVAATAQTILASWAYAESVNDFNLLIQGYAVPKVKTEASWATDLTSVLAEDGAEDCIYTGVDQGDHYEDYLRLFLFTMNESTRLLRMMDLIQINMRYLYYGDFSMEDYYGGVSFTYDINGKPCHGEDTYE